MGENRELQQYMEEHILEARRLLMDLSVIPAPSLKEERRAAFVKRWLEEHGAAGVYVDKAGNVIYPYETECREELFVFMAHMDLVFPDEEQLVIRQKGNLLKGPGVGDDTANLVNLMMTAAWVAQTKPDLQAGILFVADTGEEGLGNLKGCRQLMEDFKGRIRQVVSFDLYLGECFIDCIGSVRYQIEVKTQGGHSFHDFGKPNAICQLSQIIAALYEQVMPEHEEGTLTYNVGTIKGGTSVNTIAQDAQALYEIRALRPDEMEAMKENFFRIIEEFRAKGVEVEISLVGERPCSNLTAHKQAQELLADRICQLIRQAGFEPSRELASTDANIPLSMDIPAVTLGTIVGGNAHTREEWIDLDSMKAGLLLALTLVRDLSFFPKREL